MPAPDTNQPATSDDYVPPTDVNWISPGKVQIGNFYPGARAEWNITIHNGNETTTTFAVKYRYPSRVADGYDMPPLEAQDWVIIVDSTPVLAPKETRDILIVLAMPQDAVVVSKKWEFWISVAETAQTGLVTTELASRWQVVMR